MSRCCAKCKNPFIACANGECRCHNADLYELIRRDL